jgi:hypothetical protein
MAFKVVNGQTAEGGEGATLYRWTTRSQTLVGIYEGVCAGKYGPDSIIKLRTPEGPVDVPNGTVLRSALKKLTVGALVQIVYLGKRRGKSGAEYMDFEVSVDDGPVGGVVTASTAPDPYAELVQRIRTEKGPAMANALAAATGLSSDPLTALQEAVVQIGMAVEAVPF